MSCVGGRGRATPVRPAVPRGLTGTPETLSSAQRPLCVLGEQPPSQAVRLGTGWQGHGSRRASPLPTVARPSGASDPVALTRGPVPSPGPPFPGHPGRPGRLAHLSGQALCLLTPLHGLPLVSLCLRQTGGGEGPQEIPSGWQLGPPPATRGKTEAGGRLCDEATSGLAGPEGRSRVLPLSPGSGPSSQSQRRSGAPAACLGAWEPEAAGLQARVLTNGFETCLLRPRDQPLELRGSSLPGWRLAVLWRLPPSSPVRAGLWP